MMKMNIKYRVLSIILLGMMIPALMGIHVFNHYCNACLKQEVTGSIIAPLHEHHHECAVCTCDDSCEICHDEHGNHKCHGEHSGDCQHEYLLFEYMGNLEARSFDLKIADFDLPYCSVLSDQSVQTYYTSFEQMYAHAILHIPDEPSPEQNCVFLL